ncbi:hypothetical protein WJX72_005492 [[Myrmecia] bisecta]|uniref:Uncharacterized protein n=1 Tax=[Myrmecia] bisecta TaxID=41462 RepID=A0AAW1PTP6_9CHLO
MATPSDRLVMVVLTLLSCGVYLNTFSAGFTFDDNFAVINNGDVTDAARPVWHLFTSDFWGQNIRSEQSHKSYRPLTVLSLRLQKQLSAYLPARTPLVDTGSQLVPHDNSDGLDPRPFHIANMLMHALVTLLVYRLAYQLCRAQDPAQGDGTRADAASRVEALIAGLLFACHPIHTEAVAGIVGHAELLAAAFAVSALLAYMQAAECGQRQHVYSNRLAGGGSRQHSAAKQQGSPGPLVPLQEANHMRHWALVAAAVLLTWAAALSKEIGITIAAAMVLYDAFLVPMPVEAQQQPLSSAASAIRSTRRSARLRGIVRSLWRRHQTWRMALMAVVVLIYVKGRAWLAGDHLVRIFRKVENPIPFAPTTTALLTMGYLHANWRTVLRNQDWHSEEKLFRAAQKVCWTSAKVQLNSGILERRYMNWRQALEHFELARAIEPGYCEPDYWVGLTLINQGLDIPRGLEELQKAVNCKYVAVEAVKALHKIYTLLHAESPRGALYIKAWAQVLLHPTLNRLEEACEALEQAAVEVALRQPGVDFAGLTEMCLEHLQPKQQQQQVNTGEQPQAGLATLRRCIIARQGLLSALLKQPAAGERAKRATYAYLRDSSACRVTAMLDGGTLVQPASQAHMQLIHNVQAADAEDPWLQREWGEILLAQGRAQEAVRHLIDQAKMAAANGGHVHHAALTSEVALTPAQSVGNQFINQYYTVLHSSPKYLHRFYTDASTLTHADASGPVPQVSTISGQKNIHDKVMSLGLEEAIPQLYSVDAQSSLQNGVIVQVTGTLLTKNKLRRFFTQTFFLAVQEKGFFVLNDIFRFRPDNEGQELGFMAPAAVQAAPKPCSQANGYMGGKPAQPHAPQPPLQHQPQPPHPHQAPLQHTQPPMPPQQQPHAATSAPQVRAPVPPSQPAAAAAPPAKPAPAPGPAPAPAPSPAPAPVPTPPPQAQPSPAPKPASPKKAEPVKPAPPPQAAAVKEQEAPARAAPAAGPERSVSPVKAPPAQGEAAPAISLSLSSNGNGNGSGDQAGYFQEDVPCTSIFVRDLPADVTPEKLEAAFARFGTVKDGLRGISLKVQKGKDTFAFVEFTEAGAMQAAIDATVIIDGQKASVTEKRPQFIRPRGGGRGGSGPMRGGGGRGGRGGYMGGSRPPLYG